jgi:hypothetical protein
VGVCVRAVPWASFPCAVLAATLEAPALEQLQQRATAERFVLTPDALRCACCVVHMCAGRHSSQWCVERWRQTAGVDGSRRDARAARDGR